MGAFAFNMEVRAISVFVFVSAEPHGIWERSKETMVGFYWNDCESVSGQLVSVY